MRTSTLQFSFIENKKKDLNIKIFLVKDEPLRKIKVLLGVIGLE